MHYIMVVLACGSVACLAASRSRAILTEWLPTALMAAGMIAMAAGASPIASAVLLLASALLFARGPKRLPSLHRGLASIAMTSLALTHLPSGTTVTAQHHGNGAPSNLWLLVGLVVTIALAASAAALIRPPAREDRYGRPANNRFHRTEVLLMTAGLAAMAAPMA